MAGMGLIGGSRSAMGVKGILTMSKQTTRREVLKGGVALAGLGVLGVPE